MTSLHPNGPDVSVLITAYQHQAYIGAAMESVLWQTGVSFELIVGDDCSSDGTRRVIEQFARCHPDVVRVHFPESNRGGGGKVLFSDLIELSTGRYIAGMDGDDYWTSPDKLRIQTAYLDAHPECSMVFHNVVRRVESADLPDELFHPADHPRRIGWHEVFYGPPVASVSPLFRREVLDPLPVWYFRSSWGDWPLYVMAANEGEMHYLPDVLAAHRVHAGGMFTSSPVLNRRQDEVTFWRALAGAVPQEHEDLRRRRLAQALVELSSAHLELGQRRAARASLADSYREWSPPPWRWRAGQGERVRLGLWVRTRVPIRRRPPRTGRSVPDGDQAPTR